MKKKLFHSLFQVMFPVCLGLPTALGHGAPIKPTGEVAPRWQRLPNSDSPDKKFCLVEDVDDEWRGSVFFANADRTKNLGEVRVKSMWSTEVPHDRRTTIVWAPDSTRVTIHDSLAGRNSTLLIFRLAGEKFELVALPDLLSVACERWGIRPDRVANSGQRPTLWTADDTVTVEVTAKLKGGGERNTTLLLHVPKETPPTVRPK